MELAVVEEVTTPVSALSVPTVTTHLLVQPPCEKSPEKFTMTKTAAFENR